MTRAKFRAVADLEGWDQPFDRGLTKPTLRELSTHSFIENGENLLILGKTGEGEMYLAVAIGRSLCADGVSTLFMPVNFLFEEVLAARVQVKYLPFKNVCRR